MDQYIVHARSCGIYFEWVLGAFIRQKPVARRYIVGTKNLHIGREVVRRECNLPIRNSSDAVRSYSISNMRYRWLATVLRV